MIEEYTSRSVVMPVETCLDKKVGNSNRTPTEANHCGGISILSGGEERSAPAVTNHTEERQRKPQGSLVFEAMESKARGERNQPLRGREDT